MLTRILVSVVYIYYLNILRTSFKLVIVRVIQDSLDTIIKQPSSFIFIIN